MRHLFLCVECGTQFEKKTGSEICPDCIKFPKPIGVQEPDTFILPETPDAATEEIIIAEQPEEPVVAEPSEEPVVIDEPIAKKKTGSKKKGGKR